MPLAAVLAIYARENGAGTMFEPEAAYDEDAVSLNDDDETSAQESETVMSVIDGDKPDHADDQDNDRRSAATRWASVAAGSENKTGPVGPVLLSAVPAVLP